MTQPLIGFATPSGVVVSLDETGRYPALVVTYPKALHIPPAFVSACHHAAGELGADIRFEERVAQ